MSVTTGDLVKQLFTICDPLTGAAIDADSLPSGVLWLNGVANGATVTIADATGTGKYTFSVTIPTVTQAQRVQVIVDATIGGVACSGEVWADQATPSVNVTSLEEAVETEIQARVAAALTAYEVTKPGDAMTLARRP